MQTTQSTKQKSPLIGWNVCATILITLFIFTSHPPAISMAQSLHPKILYKENAKYTEEARENVTHGTVALSVVFRSDGSITDIRTLSGLPYGLNEMAISAARAVRFEPGIKDGQPVSVRGRLEFTFNLYALDEKSIRKMLRNDFPGLSDKVVETMATILYAGGNRETDKAWLFGKQCLEKGSNKLPQSEQEESTNLKLEAIQALDEADQQIYQKLMDKSKTEQLPDYEEMQIIEFRFRGISRLPGEKRKRAEALFNKAAALGAEIP
jgi:TonB family protein